MRWLGDAKCMVVVLMLSFPKNLGTKSLVRALLQEARAILRR